MRLTKLLAIIFVGIFGSALIGLSIYFFSVYYHRDTNHRFEAATIAQEGYFDYISNDLGVINPGETVVQEIPVKSKLEMQVNLTFTFVGNETELGNYIILNVDGYDDLNGHTLNENIKNSNEKFTYKRTLESLETITLKISYQLIQSDDVPISTALDFKIRFNAVNNPYIYGR